MPEEPEVETERLHEAIHEELEREGGHLLRRIALTTALLAAVAAIASLRAGGTVNEALALKTDATRLQAEASDQWSPGDRRSPRLRLTCYGRGCAVKTRSG